MLHQPERIYGPGMGMANLVHMTGSVDGDTIKVNASGWTLVMGACVFLPSVFVRLRMSRAPELLAALNAAPGELAGSSSSDRAIFSRKSGDESRALQIFQLEAYTLHHGRSETICSVEWGVCYDKGVGSH